MYFDLISIGRSFTSHYSVQDDTGLFCQVNQGVISTVLGQKEVESSEGLDGFNEPRFSHSPWYKDWGGGGGSPLEDGGPGVSDKSLRQVAATTKKPTAPGGYRGAKVLIKKSRIIDTGMDRYEKKPRHLADTVGRSCQWRTRLALDPQHAPPRNTPRQREFARPTGSEPDLYRRAGACGTNIFGRPASTLVSRRLRVRLA